MIGPMVREASMVKLAGVPAAPLRMSMMVLAAKMAAGRVASRSPVVISFFLLACICPFYY